MKIEKRLEELGITLPMPPEPQANYIPVRRSGNLLFFSGAGPFRDGKLAVFGKLGADLTLEQGYDTARLIGLNLLTMLKEEIGDLDKVSKIIKVQGFVASTPDFTDQPKVINGASDLFEQVFGERGKHARTAVAAPVLPFNIAVEIEMIVEIKD